MATSKELKNSLRQDWQQTFPELTLFGQNKLYKIVECLILGIELIKLPMTTEFRPHLVAYTLWGGDFRKKFEGPTMWKKDFKADFGAPFILMEFYNKRGRQFDVPYDKYTSYMPEMVESIKQQALLPLEGDISFKMVLAAIDKYSQVSYLRAAPNSFLQAILQEIKLMITLYVSEKEARNLLEQINKRDWDTEQFKMYRVDKQNWLDNLQAKIEDREAFLEIIDINKQDKKISKLKHFEFVK